MLSKSNPLQGESGSKDPGDFHIKTGGREGWRSEDSE